MSDRIAQIESRLNAASPGPWDFGTAYSADGERELVTKAGKADFLSLALNDNRTPLFVIDNGEVIPAVTGDGPNARANAALIANAPEDLRYLLAVIAAAKPRTITTVEELDALPENTVIRDAEPATMQLMDGKWWSVGSSLPWDADTIDLPATVLHEPGASL